MKSINAILPVLAALVLGACSQDLVQAPEGPLQVIPAPNVVTLDGTMRKVSDVQICKRLDKSLPEEGYRLTVSAGKVELRYGSEAGKFYGMKTIEQEKEAYGGCLLCGTICDSPRYAWRGFMLDEARHFFGVEKVKQLLDEMGRFKMNRFHWHLTDAQGWRIEIKSRPKLTEVGAALCHSNPDTCAMFYTQDQIREIVEYAAARHIMVIPEIDLPGHVSAATLSYPEISGGGVVGGWPGFTLNIAAPQTMEFVKDVLKEVADLFPAPYLHIGGDEVSYGSYAWLSNPDIRAFMDANGYGDDVLKAEAHFIREVADYVETLGKTVVGWNDVQNFGLDKDKAVMMWWRHNRPDQLHGCLEDGYPTILCPRNPCYYDYVQHATHTQGPKWPLDGGFSPLEDVCAFPDGWDEKWEFDAGKPIGIQANLWTEKVHNTARFDYMVYPRLCGLSESAWTAKEAKDYSSFEARMKKEYARFDSLGIRYCSVWDPELHPEPAVPQIDTPDLLLWEVNRN